MNQFWNKLIHELTPYIPGEQPKANSLLKLNTNENPYGPSPKVLATLQTEIKDELRLYPDPDSTQLKHAIAENFDLVPSQIFVGNGSDEVLAHAFLALLKHDHAILLPDITYSFYPVYCQLYGIDFKTIPLNADFQINIADYLHPEVQENGGIIFPNPNAPTGCALTQDAMVHLLQANRHSVVIVDEAYVDFGAESAVPLIHKYPNLLVVQTFSKSRSLAGLRVGYALGHASLIEALTRVKDSFNSYPIDRLAQAGAYAALNDLSYFEETRRKIIASREWLISELAQLGFNTLPSLANFVLTRHPTYDAMFLATKLREYGIVVRHFKNPLRIAPYIRITIGTDQQCSDLISALRKILS